MIVIDRSAIERLKREALDSPAKTARICLHANHQELIQEMIIAAVAGHSGPAFRHMGLRKTYIILDGVLRVTFFSDDGTHEEEIILDRAGEGGQILSFQGDRWHACEALSTVAVYAETLPGPFTPGRGERKWWKNAAPA